MGIRNISLVYMVFRDAAVDFRIVPVSYCSFLLFTSALPLSHRVSGFDPKWGILSYPCPWSQPDASGHFRRLTRRTLGQKVTATPTLLQRSWLHTVLSIYLLLLLLYSLALDLLLVISDLRVPLQFISTAVAKCT